MEGLPGAGSPGGVRLRGRAFLRAMDHVEEAALVLLFVVMAVVAFVNVITRYFIRYSLAFTEEIVVAAFVWVTLLGAAIGFRQRAHLAFTYVTDRLPVSLRRASVWFAASLSVVLFAFLVHFGLKQIRLEQQMNFTTEALNIPQWWYTAGVPGLSLVVIVRIVQGALRADRGMRR